MKQCLVLLILVITMNSCRQDANDSKNSIHEILNTNSLPSQIFSININKNNTILTQGGTYIQIEKGAISSNQDIVEIEVKEALNTEQIALAGLTTETNGMALSSGGMIYFNAAVGYQFEIKKAIKVFVPTQNYNSDMQLYEGKLEKDSTINWVNPKQITKNSKLSHGEQLFVSNCQSCHAINSDATGPALWNVQNRRTRNWLYDFTRNSAKVIAVSGAGISQPVDAEHDIMKYSNGGKFDMYANCLFTKWNKTAMTAFPSLSDNDLDDLYTYIKIESDKHPELESRFSSNCCDSCIKYKAENAILLDERQQLVISNSNFFTLKQIPPILTNSIIVQSNISNNASNTNTSNSSLAKDFVVSKNEKSVYYEFSITTTGWFNIDMLLKNVPGIKNSSLMVRIQGEKTENYHIVLIVPSRQAFIEGGLLEDNMSYGFYEKNGMIPLPIGDSCYVIAYGEQEAKFKLGYTRFAAQENQVIKIATKESAINRIQDLIKSFNLKNIDVNLKDSKNANEIRELDSKLKKNEKWKPANCDCDIINIRSEKVNKGYSIESEFK